MRLSWLVLLCCLPVSGAVFTVVNTQDAGPGSLREAILSANATPQTDEIRFSLPTTGVQTISPSTPLPTITNTLIIDGFSQSGSRTNSEYWGNDAELRVRLDGLRLSNSLAPALTLKANGSSIRGLVIVRFAFGIRIDGSSSNRICGNWIGIDCDNLARGMTFAGVEVTGSAFRAAMYNTIGGPEIADQNIIGGNGVGVSFFPMAAGNNFVEGNMIGTDLRGRLPRGNVFEAVSIQSATNIHITRNLLAASTGAGGCGIRMIGSAGNSIMNNEIGNGLGSTDLGNSGDGVAAQGSSQVTIDDNYIDFNRGYGINMIGCDNWIIRKNRIGVAASGGETFGNLEGGIYLQDCSTNLLEENGIAMNGGPGISIRSGIANRITENFSLDNMGLGIDLGADGDTENDPGDTDLGANNLQNFPVLTEAMGGNGALTVSGHLASLPSQTYRIEIFLTSPWFPWDESEGQVPIGWTNVITDAAGEVSFTFQYPLEPWIEAGTRVTATTTDPMGNTSEFSPSILLVSKADPPTLGVLAAGGTLTFCWPADSSGFSLEVADSLTTPPADWHRVMSEIVVRDGRQCFTVTNSAAKPQQFFRLCK